MKKKDGVDSSGLLRLYDRCVGVFAELFDTRLLTPMVTALLFYTVLFTQRKFPMRWMYFVLFGMVLVLIVSFTARTPACTGALAQGHGGALVRAARMDGRLRPLF